MQGGAECYQSLFTSQRSTVNASSVQFTRPANAATVYLLRLELDNQPIFETTNSSFSNSINVGLGLASCCAGGLPGAGDLNSDSSFTVSGSGGKQTVSRKLLPSNGTHFWQPKIPRLQRLLGAKADSDPGEEVLATNVYPAASSWF